MPPGYSGGSATATTNSSGGYTLNVVPGTYSSDAAAVGYLMGCRRECRCRCHDGPEFCSDAVRLSSGTVTNATGAGIANAAVSYSGLSLTVDHEF